MKIAVLPGDGIGKEVTAQGVKALKAALGGDALYELQEAPSAARATRRWQSAAAGDARTLPSVRRHSARGFRSPGGRAQAASAASRLRITGPAQGSETCSPTSAAVFLFPELIGASSLKREVVEGLDLIILRELNGGLYYGEPRGIETTASGERRGFNTMCYNRIRSRAHRPCRFSRSA